jgi:hypothetical protein
LLDRPLCNSHIISEFLFRILYDKNHRYIEVPDIKEGKVRKGQSGYKQRLLCSACEKVLNRYERHSRRLFRDALPPPLLGAARMREFHNLDYRLLKLFFLSVLWRASLSSLPIFRHVSLGPHEETLRNMILSGDAGSEADYATLFFILHLDGQHLRDFMVEPTFMRVEGHKCYRLVLSGFVVLIFVSSQQVPDPLPRVVLSPSRPVRGYDAEFGQFAFLRAVWEKAAEVTKHREI